MAASRSKWQVSCTTPHRAARPLVASSVTGSAAGNAYYDQRQSGQGCAAPPSWRACSSNSAGCSRPDGARNHLLAGPDGRAEPEAYCGFLPRGEVSAAARPDPAHLFGRPALRQSMVRPAINGWWSTKDALRWAPGSCSRHTRNGVCGRSGISGQGSPGAAGMLRYSASRSAFLGNTPTSMYRN